MAGNNQGPGCLYVQSKISKPDILDENTFLKWYDEHHIPDMLRTSAVKSAFRFQDIDSEAGKPYLVIYPLNDLGFLSSDEFRNVSVQGDPLPGAGNVFDMADFDARFDSLIQVYDPTEKGKGHTKSIISVQIELKEGADAEDFDKWYREEHLGLLSKATGFLRTTRYKLEHSIPNSKARAYQGLATTNQQEPEVPVWLSIHEFEVEKPDLLAIKALTASPWTERIYEGRKLGIFKVYKLLAGFGEENLFHGVKV